MRRRLIYLAFQLLVCPIFVFGQLPNEVLLDKIVLNSADSGVFRFGFNNTCYMRNTEYFNPIEEGRTFFGYQLAPSVSYQPSAQSILKLGAWIRHDFGGNLPFTQIIPTFTLKVTGKSSELLFGTLEGALSHQMIEPLMDINSVIERRIENGFQFKFNRPKFLAETWINWEKFLEFREFDKERFTAGLRTEYKPLQKSSKHELSIYYQMMVNHQGGQIDIDTIQPFLMFYNGAVGIRYNKKINTKVKAIADFSYVQFKELSDSKIFLSSAGSGLYLNAGIEYGLNTILVTYWKGKDYNSPRGTSIYQSHSTVLPSNYQKDRDLLFFRWIRNAPLMNSPFTASARFEPVYDLNNRIFDFSYSLYLVYNFGSNRNKKRT